MTRSEIESSLIAAADASTAERSQRFFKTGPGEYAEGDQFRGIRVPILRKMATEFHAVPMAVIRHLLTSAFHEDRLLALFILVRRYRKGDPEQRSRIFDLYLDHLAFVNNWDLVDSSAEHIVGAHLVGKDRDLLEHLARSQVLWDRRIAVLATFHFIKKRQFDPFFDIAELLVHDREDLIQKAVGWMLREVGERDRAREEKFLHRHYTTMPRTMLRYAIEKFDEPTRQAYLTGQV